MARLSFGREHDTHSVVLKELKKAFRFGDDAIILPSLESLRPQWVWLFFTSDDRRVARDVTLARSPMTGGIARLILCEARGEMIGEAN